MTISGTVIGPESEARTIRGRTIDVVNIETNERQRSSTNAVGGFVFRVRPGRYRLELTLRAGESFVKHPGVMTVSQTDGDTRADLVIRSRPQARPHGPAYRVHDGLGSPRA